MYRVLHRQRFFWFLKKLIDDFFFFIIVLISIVGIGSRDIPSVFQASSLPVLPVRLFRSVSAVSLL